MTIKSVKNLDYNELVKHYGGKNILIIDDEIMFADKSNKLVFEFAKKHFPDKI
jgi:hypothetical protein